MGYSRYWKQVKLPTKDWENFSKVVANIIGLSEVKIVNWSGDEGSKPTLSKKEIRFNGCGDDGCETFLIENKEAKFNSCKTNRRDYDIVVAACLYAYNDFTKGMAEISNDGDNYENEAVALYKSALPSIVQLS